MNKEIFDQLPADEAPVATKLNSVSENMKVPQNFQWKLESQLMDAYQNKSQPTKGWFSKIIVPAGWVLAAVFGFLLVNWTIRSLVPPDQVTPGSSNTEIPVESFESKFRRGSICADPLALEHGFAVSLMDQGQTGFIPFDEEKAIGELRSFAWSTNGERLAVLGNTTGSGNIYLTDSSGSPLQPVLTDPQMGYLFYFAWSSDGQQFIAWSLDNQDNFYLFNADGGDLKEIQLDLHVLGAPQFAPGNRSIVLRGADTSTYGLFELALDGSRIRQISRQVEDESSYAWSPDGSHLAYIEKDRDLGEARLVLEEASSNSKVTLGTLPIPKGSGSSLPDVANLSWSQDGTKLVFEFGRNAANRAVYLAYADGSGLVKVIDSAYAPTISPDGNCLAYISSKQVFILDLNAVSLTSNSASPLFLADLPAGRGTAEFRLDELQWRP